GYISVAGVPEFCPTGILLHASKSTDMSLSHLSTLCHRPGPGSNPKPRAQEASAIPTTLPSDQTSCSRTFRVSLRKHVHTVRVQLYTVHLECSSVSIMKYRLQQRVFIYDNFVKYESWRKVVTNFRQSFPDSPEPAKVMIYNLVKKFRTTESVLDKKRICVEHVLTEKMLDETRHRHHPAV
ncbi:hypothetical protein ANN_14785, partial [Periplaneta americana]